MFAIEINFKDGVSQPEMILVRRPQALIGASEQAHVVLEDMKELPYQIRLIRELGRRFRCKPIGVADNAPAPALLEGIYDGGAAVELGAIKLFINALDADLGLRETEPPDRAGVRVLRQAMSSASPIYPAVAVLGTYPTVVSFVPDQPVYIGRSKQCTLRLDSTDISAKHARVGFESGEFWVEDLGSTNGTFINQQQISGRMNVAAGVPIVLGREITIVGITSEDQLNKFTRRAPEKPAKTSSTERRYPVLVAISEVARPARVVLHPGQTLNLGRDPASDMWLGTPQVSRKHCTVGLSKTGALTVSDHSTNGTGYPSGVLRRGEVFEVGSKPTVLNFGANVTVAICFNEEEERAFIAAHGSPYTFQAAPRNEASDAPGEQGPGLPAVRDVLKFNSRVINTMFNLFRSQRMSGKVLAVLTLLGVLVVIAVIVHLLVSLFV